MTDLSALIARVEEGTDGPDREIDCLVAAETDIQIDGVSASWKALVAQFGIEWAVSVANDYHSIWRTELPRYTTSLDAVLSLIEQKLPGWCPDVGKVPPFALAPDDYEWTGALMGNEREVTYGHGEPPEMAFDTYNGHANSGARALLAATLRALSALEESKADLADANTKGPSHDA